MTKDNTIILLGLKDLADLETGKIPKTKKTSQNIINDGIDRLEELENIFISKSAVDSETKLKKKNKNSISEFSNDILIKSSSPKTPKENITPKKVEPKKESVFDIINQASMDKNTDLLDQITTESDTIDDFMNKINAKQDEKVKKCKGCKSSGSLVEDHQTSVIVCLECGMVNEEMLDHGPEWRQYNNEDNNNEGVGRCGCPSNYFFPKSSQGTIMAGSSNSRLKRKQKWNIMVYKERSLNAVFEYITNICSKNNIPKIIIDSAKILYKKISDCKHKDGVNIGKQVIIRGENRLSIIAACVFRACEMNKNPRNIKEISTFFKLDEKKVTKGNKQFDKIMKNTDDNSLMLDRFSTNTAEDYIRRHTPKLVRSKNSNKAVKMAVKIAHNCCRMKLASDHNPQSIAAGSILLMVQCCDLDVDKKDIAKIFGTSDVTITKIYNKIEPYSQALVDDELTEHLIQKFKING